MEEIFELRVLDGELLKGLKWTIDNPKANVIIMEGMEEHAYRYRNFALFLNENGYNVYALDYYGQGLNVKDDFSNCGFWPKDGFSKQVTAFDILVTKLNEEGLKTYIFAHSMGSFMAQKFMEEYPNHVDKVILCGSGGKNPMLGIGHLLAKLITNKKNYYKKANTLNKLMFGGFNNRIKNPKTSFDWLSFNEENVNKYVNDPLCGFHPNNGFCLEFIKGMLPLYKKKNLMMIDKDIKIHIISGIDDPVTDYTKFVYKLSKMYNSYGINNVSSQIFPNMRHEILNEKDNVTVYSNVLNFLEA